MAGALVSCPFCRQDVNAPEESLGRQVVCPHCGTPLPAQVQGQPLQTAAIGIERLRDPNEKIAAMTLLILSFPVWAALVLLLALSPEAFAAILISIIFYGGIFALIALVGKVFLRARVRTHGLRVSPSQFPDIYAAAVEVCRKLNIPMPEIFIMQENIWNAWAARLVGTRMVVLLSGAIDSILLKGDMSQVVWLMGHEIGHHAAGHCGWKPGFLKMGAWCIWVWLWYKRRCEMTCDRIGLYAANSSDAAIKGLCNMTAGAQLSQSVNVEEALAQWEMHRREFFVRYSIIYSTHPPHLWRIQRTLEAAQELGIGA